MDAILGSNDTFMEFKSALETANAQLAARGSRLRIEQRGRRLNLRGSLPLRGDPSQNGLQRISLGLMAISPRLMRCKPFWLGSPRNGRDPRRFRRRPRCSMRRRDPRAASCALAVSSALLNSINVSLEPRIASMAATLNPRKAF